MPIRPLRGVSRPKIANKPQQALQASGRVRSACYGLLRWLLVTSMNVVQLYSGISYQAAKLQQPCLTKSYSSTNYTTLRHGFDDPAEAGCCAVGQR